MARRKSLLAQMYEARQNAKLQQQKEEARASREWAAEERRIAALQAKDEAAARRKAQQDEQERQRLAAQAERQEAARQREAARRAAAAAREEQQRAAAERRAAVERRVAEAEFLTSAAQATITAFDRLLADRARSLAALSRQVEDAFNAGGPEALAVTSTSRREKRSSLYPASRPTPTSSTRS